jgi:small-conductance mechanosensitive channel
LLKSRIRNYRQLAERRAVIVTTVAPDTTPEQLARAPKIIEEVVSAQTLARLERSRVRAITDAGFEIETSFHVSSPEFRIFADTRHAVLLGLVASFRRENIALAFRTAPAAPTPALRPPQ